LRAVSEVAQELGISEEYVFPYGKSKAKVGLGAIRDSDLFRKHTKLILVTGMTPTPFGEGKTVTSIGLAMGLRKLGRSSVVCLRQPSLGPIFGIKGGAAGGGKSTVEPMQEINLGLTGDIYAVTSAHNLLSAMIDNHIFHGNELSINPATVTWPRAIDMNDRALRHTMVAVGKKEGVPREDGFVISAASEVMAILCLSRDYADLKDRLGRIIIGNNREGNVVVADSLKVFGSMAAILKNALEPNLVQTAEGTPALVHGGPFGNIAHGTASVLSIQLGLKSAEYCVVETGFASDLGAEKFVDIVTQAGSFDANVAVVVASVRALKHHGGESSENVLLPDQKALNLGLENLRKHIENTHILGLEPVVAINKFPTDTDEELKQVEQFCLSQGVSFAVSTPFENGGVGAIELAERVVEASAKNCKSKPLYSLTDSIEIKLNLIVNKIYGGTGIDFGADVKKDSEWIGKLGLANNPICVAKTQLSLSDDPRKLGRPVNFTVFLRKISPDAGAGFNVAYMGDIVTMPGLPKHPAAENINLTDDGTIIGLY